MIKFVFDSPPTALVSWQCDHWLRVSSTHRLEELGIELWTVRGQAAPIIAEWKLALFLTDMLFQMNIIHTFGFIFTARIGRATLTQHEVESMLKNTPARKKGSRYLFRSMHNKGQYRCWSIETLIGPAVITGFILSL